MTRHHDVMRLLAEARPERLDPGPSSVDLVAITNQRQENRARPAPRRAPRRRLLLTAGLVPTAALGALAVALVINQSTVTPQPVTEQSVVHAPGTAQEMLLAAAEQISKGEATSGRYWVIKVEEGNARQVGPVSRAYTIMSRTSIEYWLATSPGDRSWAFTQDLGSRLATAADEAAWRADGAPTQWTQPVSEDAPKGTEPVVITAAGGPRHIREMQGHTAENNFLLAGQPVSLAALAALPADPTALRAYLLTRYTGTGSLENRDEYLFWGAMAIVLDLPVSPQVRAAGYRMIAGMDAVTTLGVVTDQHSRKGVAVGYFRRGDGANLTQTRLIIDPRTGQALAAESWNLGKSAAASSGELMSYTVVTSAGWTDETPPKA